MLYIVLTSGIIAISSASILIKWCDAPALVIASYRLAFASLIFLGGNALKNTNPLKPFSARDLRIALISGLFLCLHFAAWISSLKYTSVASSVALVATAPVFVAIGSTVFLKEKPGKALFIGIPLTILGALVLSSKDFNSANASLFGNFLALLGAIGAAGYLLAGRELRRRIDTGAYVTVVYFTTAVLLVTLTALTRHSFIDYSAKVFGLFFLIAFVPQVIGHTSFNWLLKHFSAATVSILTLSEPVGASILAYLLLGEKLAAVQIIGGGIILTGVVIALRGELS